MHDDEEAFFSVGKPTVFFLPHCPRWLYQNVLARNWTQAALLNVCIIGNSFSGIMERRSLENMGAVSEAIYQSCTGKCLIESPISEDKTCGHAFSRTSLMFVWKLPVSETPVVECMDLVPSSATFDGSSSHVHVIFAINIREEVSLLLNIEDKTETDKDDLWLLLVQYYHYCHHLTVCWRVSITMSKLCYTAVSIERGVI